MSSAGTVVIDYNALLSDLVHHRFDTVQGKAGMCVAGCCTVLLWIASLSILPVLIWEFVVFLDRARVVGIISRDGSSNRR